MNIMEDSTNTPECTSSLKTTAVEMLKRTHSMETLDTSIKSQKFTVVGDVHQSVQDAENSGKTLEDANYQLVTLMAQVEALKSTLKLQESQVPAASLLTDFEEAEINNLSNPLIPSIDPSLMAPQLKAVVEALKGFLQGKNEWGYNHWYTLYAQLPSVCPQGKLHLIVPKVPGQSTQFKNSCVGEPFKIGELPQNQWEAKAGFMVQKNLFEQVKQNFPQIKELQMFASKLAGQDRVAAVWFHLKGLKSPSHYHVLIGTRQPWSTIDVRNHLTKNKLSGIRFRRATVKNLAWCLMHNTAPIEGNIFVGSTSQELSKLVKTCQGKWSLVLKECHIADLHNTPNGLGQEENDPDSEVVPHVYFDKEGALNSSMEVIRRHSQVSKASAVKKYYIELLKGVKLQLYTVEQLERWFRDNANNNHPAHAIADKLIGASFAVSYYKSILSSALGDIAYQKMKEPLEKQARRYIESLSQNERIELSRDWIASFNELDDHLFDKMCIVALILDKRTEKLNSVYIHGPTSVGKTSVFIRALSFIEPACSILWKEGSDFYLEDLGDPHRVVFIEELSVISQGHTDNFKQMTEGADFEVSCKHKRKKVSYGSPVIMTSNVGLEKMYSYSGDNVQNLHTRIFLLQLSTFIAPFLRSIKHWRYFWALMIEAVSEVPFRRERPSSITGDNIKQAFGDDETAKVYRLMGDKLRLPCCRIPASEEATSVVLTEEQRSETASICADDNYFGDLQEPEECPNLEDGDSFCDL